MLPSHQVTAAILALTATLHALKKPDILFVLTDDQDRHMNSLDDMPLLQKYLFHEGTTFDRHDCTVSVCCPSRVNLWTEIAAQQCHRLVSTLRRLSKFVREGLNENWLLVWLQQLGYDTHYTGKLFNVHDVDRYASPPFNGFNESDFLLDPYAYEYYSAWMTRNNEPPVSYAGQYSPNVVAQKASGFINEAALRNKPFFLGAAPVAPHANVQQVSETELTPPKYAERHARLSQDYKIPRTESLNPDRAGGVGWIKDLPQLNKTALQWHNEFQRSRLRALRRSMKWWRDWLRISRRPDCPETPTSSTPLIMAITSRSTGYHLARSAHLRWVSFGSFYQELSANALLEDIPSHWQCLAQPSRQDLAGVISSHTDLSYATLKLAGGKSEQLDGWPIPLDGLQLAAPDSGEHVNVEFWGRAFPESICSKLGDDCISAGHDRQMCSAARNNTYKALKVVGSGYNILYSVWCTGEKIHYDMNRDPHQTYNYLDPDRAIDTRAYSLGGRPFEHLFSRLKALLVVIKDCKARDCHEPWPTLHPRGDVEPLLNALNRKYDDFHAEQPRVQFSSCEPGCLIEAQGPQDVNTFGERKTQFAYPLVDEMEERQQTFQYRGHWSWRT